VLEFRFQDWRKILLGCSLQVVKALALMTLLEVFF